MTGLVRYQVIEKVMAQITDQLVVCTIGHPCQELYKINDRAGNFYMLGSMGMASSIGLGLAMASDNKVVVLDGDSASVMNMGSFATMGFNAPPNLVHIIIDNEANGSTGFQPSFSARNVRLDQVAQACSMPHVKLIERPEDISPAVADALASDQMHTLVIKAEIGLMPGIDLVPLGPDEILERFMAAASSYTIER